MKKLTIFIDMDGTIERLLDVWVTRLNEKYSRDVKLEEIVHWDMTKAYPGLTVEDLYSVLDDSIWGQIQPIDGASDVIKHLIDKGHDVFIVTATPYKSIVRKMDDLLFRWFPYLTWDNVIIMTKSNC